MKRKVQLIGTIIIGVFLVGCSLLSQSSSYAKTKELAIQQGLVAEGVTKDDLLSIEEHKGETIVFFKKETALGVASVSKSIRGYRWYGGNPLMIYDPTLEYFRGGLQVTTEKEEIIKILAGAVNESSINKILLRHRDSNKEEVIWNREESPSKFFYYILDDTASIPEVVPVK